MSTTKNIIRGDVGFRLVEGADGDHILIFRQEYYGRPHIFQRKIFVPRSDFRQTEHGQ